MNVPPDAFDAAVSAYENGDLLSAQSIAESLVGQKDANGDANNLLSVIAQDQGRLSDAETLAQLAVATEDINPIYLNTLANALLLQGRTEESIDVFERARRAMPDNADILFNLGNALRDAGRYAEAVEAFRTSLAVRPGVAAAYNNLAITLKAMGDPEGAVTLLIEALAFSPNSPEIRFNLGNALHALGRAEAAEAAYRRATDLEPRHADAWVNLGVVLAEQNKKTKAEESFQRAIKLDPSMAPAYVGLADLADDGSLSAVAHRRHVLALRPDLAAIRSSLLMCMHYTSDATPEDLFEEHVAFGDHISAFAEPRYASDHIFTTNRPLRLGVVSGDFRFHAMRFFACPVFAARPDEDWKLVCYSTTARPDAFTADFHQIADRWRDVRTVPDDALAELIVRDNIDILIDLSGHAPHNRLPVFAQRPAPLQVAWGDYVNTRGFDAIDILIGDAVHTPKEDELYYVERVVRMPRDYICYQPPSYLAPIATAPSDKNGYITFGSFSELTKIQPETVVLWAKVLKAVPDARFYVNNFLLADETLQGRVYSLFGEAGVGSDRIVIGTGGEHADFLDQYRHVDLVLDTWPYSGGLTSCESLVMGVPVITLTGERFCGRHATAHLSAAGFSDWAATDEDSFVEIAAKLAKDPHALSPLRRQVRDETLASPLCDIGDFSKAFYAVLKDEWKKVCAAAGG